VNLIDQSLEIIKDTAIKYGKEALSQTISSKEIIPKPTFSLNLGSEEFTSEKSSALINLKSFRGIGLPTDGFEINLNGHKKFEFKNDEEAKIEIGYGDKKKVVFKGLITNIDHDLSIVRVSGIGFASKLLRLRLSRVYLNQTVGKIISSIAQEANISIKTISDGINLPSYVIDEATNGFEQILRLAERCNFNVLFDEEKLVVKLPETGKTNNLRFGKEIIDIATFSFLPLFGGAKICGESPSSFKGSDTSHWLTKQDIKGEDGNNVLLSLQDPAIKDKDAAQTVAKSKNAFLSCKYGLTLTVIGNVDIELGDTVVLEQLPIDSLESNLEVRSLEHTLSKTKGFVTKINCSVRRNTQ
jgi:hypothetical protein